MREVKIRYVYEKPNSSVSSLFQVLTLEEIEEGKFITSRIAPALNEYTTLELIEVGEKIALFNGWNNGEGIDDLMEFNKRK